MPTQPGPREHLLEVAPYQLADTGPADDVSVLQLAQNENYSQAGGQALAAARDACASGARYPPADAAALRWAIAALHGLDPDRVICGRGAMELIFLLASAYLEPGRSAIISQYGYLYFKTAIQLTGATVLTAPEPKFFIDPDAILQTLTDTTRMVLLANPGNPTGSYVMKKHLIRLRAHLPSSILLVVDEAYAEYVDPDRYEPCFDLVEQGNTVVLRTFSKIYGLAGMRVGWGYFPTPVADILMRIHQPNALTGPSQAAAAAAIGDQGHVQHLRLETARTRGAFIAALAKIGLAPFGSHGNFVLVRFDSASQAAGAEQHLRANRIIVRPMQGYGLADCLRITLGTEAQMRRVAAAFKTWRQSS